MDQTDSQPQLYIVTDASAAAAERIPVVLANVPIAALLVRAASGERFDEKLAAQLIGQAQKSNVAVLTEGDPALALRLGCDGVHLPWSTDLAEQFKDARRTLGPEAIVGASAGKSRHDAMVLAESGADYVGFGVPVTVKDKVGGRAKRDALAAWCAELFETPCVAFDVETSEEAAALAAAGVGFIGVTLPDAMTQDDLSAFVRSFIAIADSSSAYSDGPVRELGS